MKEFHRFKLKTFDDLQSDLDALEVSLPFSENLTVLGEPVSLDGWTLPNRFIVQPMEGVDGEPEDGSPSEYTFRRYRRFAEGGSGLLWGESAAVVPEGCSGGRQLQITESNLDVYKRLVEQTRQAALNACGHEIVMILQLTHSGRFCRPNGVSAPMKAHHNPYLDEMLGMKDLEPVSDDYLDNLQDKFVTSARLAAKAGFDGVDLKGVHGYLIAELLGAHRREGRYGGSFENRTRFLRETFRKTRDVLPPQFFVTSRFTALEPTPYPYGWGVASIESDTWEMDITEPKRLLAELVKDKPPILNVSIGWPRVKPYLNRPHDNALIGLSNPPEYPLVGVVRFQEMIREMQSVAGEIPLPTAALTWLRHLIPEVAAGLVSEGWCSLVGLGRTAFAYPDFPRDVLEKGKIDPSKCCTTCSMCSQIMKDGVARTGCVIRDREYYGPELKKGRSSSEKR